MADKLRLRNYFLICCLFLSPFSNILARDLIAESRARQESYRNSIAKHNQEKPATTNKNKITEPENQYSFDAVYNPYWDEYLVSFGKNDLNHILLVDSNTYDAAFRTNLKAAHDVNFYHRLALSTNQHDFGLSFGSLDERKRYDLVVDLSLVDRNLAFLVKTPIGILGPISFGSENSWQDIGRGLKHNLLDTFLLKGTRAPNKPLKRIAEHFTAKTVAKVIVGKGFIPIIVIKRIFRWLKIF